LIISQVYLLVQHVQHALGVCLPSTVDTRETRTEIARKQCTVAVYQRNHFDFTQSVLGEGDVYDNSRVCDEFTAGFRVEYSVLIKITK